VRARPATPRVLNAGIGALSLALGLGPAPQARAANDPVGARTAQVCAGASITAGAVTLGYFDDSVLCLIDARRRGRGLAAFARSGLLDRSASFQSADMVEHHYFSHDHAGRPSLLARVLWSGYFDRAVTGLYAENLGYGVQQSATPERMVDAWMASPDHRANILDRRLRDIGIGTALAPPGPAFYPDYPSVVLTTDFGMRVLSSQVCFERRSPGARRSAAAVREQSMCAATTGVAR
jgi:uncharacterized protein YkwD